MDLRNVVDVAAAAERLGVSESEVRRLIRNHELEGRRIAGRWVVPAAELRRVAHQHRPAGRPYAPEGAWALLRLACNLEPGVSSVRRSQLRRVLRDRDPAVLAPLLRRRADRCLYWVHPMIATDLVADPRAYPSGWSAVHSHDGFDLAVGDDAPAEIYVHSGVLDDVIDRYALEPAKDVANLIVHVIRADRDPLAGFDVAPGAVVALDLIESGDPRAAAAGQRYWDGLLGRVRDHAQGAVADA